MKSQVQQLQGCIHFNRPAMFRTIPSNTKGQGEVIQSMFRFQASTPVFLSWLVAAVFVYYMDAAAAFKHYSV